jgi:hypothetical protein
VPTPLPPTTLAEALDRIRIGRPDQVYFVIGPLLNGPQSVPVAHLIAAASLRNDDGRLHALEIGLRAHPGHRRLTEATTAQRAGRHPDLVALAAAELADPQLVLPARPVPTQASGTGAAVSPRVVGRRTVAQGMSVPARDPREEERRIRELAAARTAAMERQREADARNERRRDLVIKALVVGVPAVLLLLVALSGPLWVSLHRILYALPRGLSRAAARVCAGEGVPGRGGAHGVTTVVMIAMDGGVQPTTDDHPDGWLPGSIEEADAVACVERFKSKIATCTYINGPPVERIVLGARVDVRRARTGEIIDSISITHEPSECDQVTEWTETTRSGDSVGYAEIAGRIRPLLE